MQQSTERLQKLAIRFDIDPKTVAKWHSHTSTEKAVRRPGPASIVLMPAEGAAIVSFRQKTLLPLDDCLYPLQEAIPHLHRSALHRCLQRHGISCLPQDEATATAKKARFKDYPLG